MYTIKRAVYKSLSVDREPSLFAGYSQSMSRPSKPHLVINVTDVETKLALAFESVTMLLQGPDPKFQPFKNRNKEQIQLTFTPN